MKVALTMATGEDERLYGTPLSLGYCAAVLRQQMPDVKLLVTQNREKICRFRPEVVGVSSVSSCIMDACAAAKKFRTEIPGAKLVLGGPHVTALPELLPFEFDYGAIWEGEDTFAELCLTLRGRGSLSDVAGLCYHNCGGVGKTDTRQPRDSMDSLPFPERSRNKLKPNEICVFTSRGCPFKCSFCASTRYWATYRMCSPEYFIDELHYILERFPSTRSIYILDDLFNAHKQRFKEMVGLLEKTGLSKRLTFHGFIKSSITDEEMMKLMKRMPMSSARFGLESASNRMLKILKGNSTVDDHVRCIELAHKYRLKCSGSWMVGGPGETEEDLMQTINFMRKWKGKLRTQGFYMATPLPSTPFWDVAKAEGVVEESREFDWSRLNLSWTNPDFDVSKACYMNGRVMPIERLLEILEREGVKKKTVLRHRARLAARKKEVDYAISH